MVELRQQTLRHVFALTLCVQAILHTMCISKLYNAERIILYVQNAITLITFQYKLNLDSSFSAFQPSTHPFPFDLCRHLFSTCVEERGKRRGTTNRHKYEKNNLCRIAVIHNRHRAIFC